VSIVVRVLGSDEAHVLDHVAADVFDHAVDPRWCAEFFADPRHHLVVALDGEVVVGMASGVHYVHPDKPPELWINEVGVAPTHEGRGLGRRLVSTLVVHGATLGCREAWVLTSPSNEAANRMYRAAGGEPDGESTVMFTFRSPGRELDT
jgi:ribosomal protein S18 acetylase RimI-like enzyme